MLVLAVVLTRGLLGASLAPLYGGPDERGHYQHVVSLQEPGGAIGVEARQPPLYYRLAAPVLVLAGRLGAHDATQRLFAVRLLSLALATTTVALAWSVAAAVFPGGRGLPLTAALFAGLLPSHAFVASTAANDGLAITLSAAALLLLSLLVRDGWRCGRAAMAALLLIAALATKLTALPVVLAAALVGAAAVVARLGRARAIAVGAAGGAAGAAAAAAIVHRYADSFVVTMLLPHVWPALLDLPQHYVRHGLPETFTTFWNPYVPDVPAPAPVLWLGGALFTLALVGLARYLGWPAARAWPATRALGVLFLAAALQVGLLGYRYSFAMELGNPMGGAAQAKFLFPALPALATLFALGIWHVYPRWLRHLVPAGLAVALLLLDALTLARYVQIQYAWLPPQ